jgi:Fe-S oxidoreductase
MIRCPEIASVDYGILGASENCCGESIRKTGDEDLFKRLAKGNIKAFVDSDLVSQLIYQIPQNCQLSSACEIYQNREY